MITLIGEAALRSLALGIIVWLAMLVLRPRNPHLQKTIWIAVLLASLAMPFALKTRMAPSFDMPTYFVTLTQSVGGTVQAAPISGWQWTLGAVTAAYALITAALLLRFVIGLFAIWRILPAATPLTHAEGLDVRVSTKITSPATFGSTILLPASSAEWNESTLTAILSHERSHVKYGDCYVQWLARVHASVFWFNPLAWWLNRRLADLAETTSDDAVLERMLDRTAYADLLLEIARHPAPTMVTSAARSNISARIERIISNVPPASPPRRWVRGAAVVALIPLFVLAAATAQTPAGPGTAASSDEDPDQPHMVDMGDHSPANYPVAAKRHGVEGWANVNATIDEDGNVSYVQIVEISPADESYGFAEAATSVAKTVRFSNPTRQPRQVKFRVKFELADKHGGSPPDVGGPRPAGG